MVRWLEANGYDVSYITGVDTDRSGGAASRTTRCSCRSATTSTGRATQRANVEAARDAGVNLAFFSGNEIFWKTRWENSIDGSRHALPHAGHLQGDQGQRADRPARPADLDRHLARPALQPAGRRRPAGERADRHACSRSTRRLGADHRCRPRTRKLRFWRNTSVATPGAPGRRRPWPTHTLGYEWDEDLDNGFRPAGLIDLSTTTVDVRQLLQDYGNDRTAPGTATHNLTLYRAASGALVFGAGTVQWSWGLDANHDTTAAPAAPADPRMQQATVNLLADMGAQPATLQAGLRRGHRLDRHARRPTSTITSPAAATVQRPAPTVTITGTATDAGGGVVGGVEVSADGGATWHPATGRDELDATPGRRARAARSRSEPRGRRQRQPRGRRRLGDRDASSRAAVPLLDLERRRPRRRRVANDPSPVELGVKFRSDVDRLRHRVRFYKGAGNTGTHVGHLWTATGTLLATATFAGETATGWQHVDVPVAGARSARTRPTSPPTTPPTATTRPTPATSRPPASTTRRCTRSPTASTAATASTPTARRRSSRPSTLPGDQLLGSTSSSARRSRPAGAEAGVAAGPRPRSGPTR